MKRSTDRIRTTHAGRLPVPAGCEGLPLRLFRGEKVEPQVINAGIDQVVRQQLDCGIDCIGDGEFWKLRTFAYLSRYFTGVETRALRPGEPASTRVFTRERDEFVQFYRDLDATGTIFHVPGEKPMPTERERAIVTGPLAFKGSEALAQEIDTFKAAIGRAGRAVDETFFCVIAPGWLDHFIFNEHYKSDEEYVFALADALREEYLAVVNAGFVLQIDDPGLPDWWDMIKPAMSVEDYVNKFAKVRIDALNHALKGIPEDRVRYHLCWGSWHGPHTHDLPFEHIIGLMLQVNAQCYSFEAANVRHEHEWRLWERTKLPDGKIILPGVVSHSTNLIEHPDLIADRIMRFAKLVGRENVIAGTDCGLGGRVHAEIAWAKLGALAEGAKLASKRLWS
ncbi:MAG: cobalamin-independent methionine synthase II family protein [Xanthobacteraceae bacterium]|nr:cobalamin-independent methionine synthase II family protein [Xanthobacteraceae bacterium]